MQETTTKKRRRRRKKAGFATSFSMRFDSFTLAMLDRIAWEEDKTRPEVIRAALKLLFLKKHNKEELESMRTKHRGTMEDIVAEEEE